MYNKKLLKKYLEKDPIRNFKLSKYELFLKIISYLSLSITTILLRLYTKKIHKKRTEVYYKSIQNRRS